MIRRNAQGPDDRAAWVLVSQVAHARLAAELAAAWRQPPALAGFPWDLVVQTVRHHDDGWTAWEQRPTLDPATGRPRDFLEMPVGESLPIWDACVVGIADLGPLAEWAVSRHFTHLLTTHGVRERWRPEERQAVDDFLARHTAAQEANLARWLSGGPDRSRAVAEAVQAWLAWFDRLSLWLCCGGTEPWSRQAPDGAALRMVRVVPEAPATGQPAEVHATPAAWGPEAVSFAVVGRLVPAGQYDSWEAVEGAGGRDATLGWVVRPA